MYKNCFLNNGTFCCLLFVPTVPRICCYSVNSWTISKYTATAYRVSLYRQNIHSLQGVFLLSKYTATAYRVSLYCPKIQLQPTGCLYIVINTLIQPTGCLYIVQIYSYSLQGVFILSKYTATSYRVSLFCPNTVLQPTGCLYIVQIQCYNLQGVSILSKYTATGCLFNDNFK